MACCADAVLCDDAFSPRLASSVDPLELTRKRDFCQVDLWARGKIDEAAAQRKLIGV